MKDRSFDPELRNHLAECEDIVLFRIKDTPRLRLSLGLFRTIGELNPSRRTPRGGSLGREATLICSRANSAAPSLTCGSREVTFVPALGEHLVQRIRWSN